MGEITTEVQDRMQNWYGHMVRRGALRRKNDDGNVRKRGRPKIRWLDRVRVISKRRDCQGRSVRPSYIIRRTSTHKTVGLK